MATAAHIPDHRRPIERLPPELLEKVLFEVAATTPPLARAYRDDHVEVYSGNHAKVLAEHLAFRMTCMTFRALSWRALAKVLDDTIFDLASRQSIRYLDDISRKDELALWLSRLNITCRAVWPCYPTTTTKAFQQE
ncbi:hypothetical protein EK21DRAFT_90911 [Setomelanomma holmii]|uniref:Uncharacterized protein n=1 Tax=Setomelanomma holmii TaxID=210430 RepID=A0A9P4H7I9_9PLEO|nr:hypothetical protein EK21DRAFT_90911 [Setomelanomma holmii]